MKQDVQEMKHCRGLMGWWVNKPSTQVLCVDGPAQEEKTRSPPEGGGDKQKLLQKTVVSRNKKYDFFLPGCFEFSRQIFSGGKDACDSFLIR